MRSEWTKFAFKNETSIINLYVNLAKDSIIRQQMATDKILTSSILSAFGEKKNISELLGLVINLMIGNNSLDKDVIVTILKEMFRTNRQTNSDFINIDDMTCCP